MSTQPGPARRPAGFRPSPTPRGSGTAPEPVTDDEVDTHAVTLVPPSGSAPAEAPARSRGRHALDRAEATTVAAAVPQDAAGAAPEDPSAAAPPDGATVAAAIPEDPAVATAPPEGTTVATALPEGATVGVPLPDGATVAVPLPQRPTVATPRPGDGPDGARPDGDDPSGRGTPVGDPHGEYPHGRDTHRGDEHRGEVHGGDTVTVPPPDPETVAAPARDATVATPWPGFAATVATPPRPARDPGDTGDTAGTGDPAGAGDTAARTADRPDGATTAPGARPVRGCPVTGRGDATGGHPVPVAAPDERDPAPADPDAAREFLEQVYAETEPVTGFAERLRQVRAEIDRTGSYRHTTHELVFGTRLAWRQSARCIGRLYWQSLQVRDLRRLHDPADVAQESIGHLRAATREGRIRSTITVFAPDAPGRPGPRIRNDQLVRYAGHREPDGTVVGDPAQAGFTDRVVAMGWPRPQPRGRFDVLPLLVTGGDGRSRLFDVPPDAVLEVPLRHPEHPWFARLGLRWHAVPAISNMPLEIGGITYPAAPFNGWYLDTEIGARNLADADRYDLLPEIARRLGLDTRSVRTMWKDRALVELTRAVAYSFDADGVTMADHHTESERFLTHVAREEAAGRSCPADWSWIVPPVSGGATPVFRRYYDLPDESTRPAFLEPHRIA